MKETLIDYIYRQCTHYLSEWNAELREDVYVLAFHIQEWGGQDENDIYVSMSSIVLIGNTLKSTKDRQANELSEEDTRWIPAFFKGQRLLSFPYYEYKKALDPHEIALYDEWLSLNHVTPTGKDEGGRNVYSGKGEALYKALGLACQEVVRRLHKRGFADILRKSIPVLISYDGRDEGIISLSATIQCNPPEVLTKFLAYANYAKNNHLHWSWMFDFSDNEALTPPLDYLQ